MSDVKKGNLEIFFGYAAGVGKTYSMLSKARELYKSGVDVVAGYVEPHARPETMELLEGLPSIPTKKIIYRGAEFKEFDIDAALKRAPRVILVDELAHTNIPGSRNKKRFQDVEELLNAGIDVYTTLNVQHIDSLNNIIGDITKITVRETIPDYIFEMASKVRLIDIEPADLLKRLTDGKIYNPDNAENAMENFFTVENLTLLREISMREAADKISNEVKTEKAQFDKKPKNTFLVCVGPSQSSAKAIRWTARAAEAFHTQWAAVYVKTGDSGFYSDKQKKTLDFNLNLAERLGAEIVTLVGYSIADVIAEYVKSVGVTDIVIGKTSKRISIFGKQLEDKIVSLIPNIEVHIVSNVNLNSFYSNYRRKLYSVKFENVRPDIIKTALILAIATVASVILKMLHMPLQNIITVYILSVLVISTATTGYLFGVLSSVLSVLLYNFAFVEPYYSFRAVEPGYPITFVIMLLVALITSTLAARLKTQVKMAAEREHRTHVLYEINKSLFSAASLSEIVYVANRNIANLFSRSVIFYASLPQNEESGAFLQGVDEDSSFLRSESERAVAYWVYENRKPAGAGTDTLSGSKAFYVPVVLHGRVQGVLGLSCLGGNIEHDDRAFLQTVTQLIALALERYYAAQGRSKELLNEEKEKTRINLLRSICHDLKTPIKDISASTDNIIKFAPKSERRAGQNEFVRSIKENSQWLMQMVDNLSLLTRILDPEDETRLEKKNTSADEVVSEALLRVKGRYPNSAIAAKTDYNLFFNVDKPLITQVLVNFIDSAVQFSPRDASVEVAVSAKDGKIYFEIITSAECLSGQELDNLFDEEDIRGRKQDPELRAAGISFLISKIIVAAHGGKTGAENKDGRTIFRFILPQ